MNRRLGKFSRQWTGLIRPSLPITLTLTVSFCLSITAFALSYGWTHFLWLGCSLAIIFQLAWIVCAVISECRRSARRMTSSKVITGMSYRGKHRSW